MDEEEKEEKRPFMEIHCQGKKELKRIEKE